MFSELFELPSRTLFSRGKNLKLSQPILMGILNATQDSFSDGQSFLEFDDALVRARKIIAEGADWLDIGGEASGPNSNEVTSEEELRRVIPIIKAVRSESDIWISVDTWKAEVARHSLDAGADAINDVSGLRADKDMARVIAEFQVPLILMYSKDSTPRTTREFTQYRDVMESIISFFSEQIEYAQSNGIQKSQIIVDPGMGLFISGNAKYSFELVRRISELHEFNLPLILGPSRKSFLAAVSSGRILNYSERDFPCALVSSIALWQGVSILRLHEVDQGRLLIDTFEKIKKTSTN